MSKLIDLTGQRFGRLTVLKYAHSDKQRKSHWLCRCDCGKQVVVSTYRLRSNTTRSCGCLRQEMNQKQLKSLSGMVFGRLTVIERMGKSKSGGATWLCQCDCGNQSIVQGSALRSGVTRSCGCLNRELVTTHGKSKERLYRIWNNMLRRCSNPSSQSYNYYGGRGIIVCPEWLNFESFYEWAIDNGYNDTLSIDRIDTNGNYEPKNVRFVSNKVQQNNKRNNHYIAYNGKTQTVAQWAEDLGINANTLYFRLSSGWSPEEALTTPVRKRKK